jgi:hypothetical protein
MTWVPIGEPFELRRRVPVSEARRAELIAESHQRRTEAKLATSATKRLLRDWSGELLARLDQGEFTTTLVQREIRASNVRLVDIGTGEVVEERAATHGEIQLALDHEEIEAER